MFHENETLNVIEAVLGTLRYRPNPGKEKPFEPVSFGHCNEDLANNVGEIVLTFPTMEFSLEGCSADHIVRARALLRERRDLIDNAIGRLNAIVSRGPQKLMKVA